MWLLKLISRYREFIFYCLIGVTGASLDFILYGLFVHAFALNYQTANFFSVSAGISNNFILNAKFNFKTKDHLLRRFACFYLVGMFGWAISAVCLFFFIEKCAVHNLLSKILTIGIVTIVQFTLNKLISFRR